MVRVIVTGVAGRMGSTIVRLIQNEPEMEIVGGTEVKDYEGIDIGVAARIKDVGIQATSDINKLKGIKADVIIDFTMPKASMKHLEFAKENGIAIVIGTTGLQEDDHKNIKEASKIIPIVQSPNMSVGVNTLFKLTELTAKILGDNYDIEIVEAHHRLKKDAPSGTAVKLGQIVAESLGRNYPEDAVFQRLGMTGERTEKEIGMQTLRGGDIVGEHTVMFAGIGERIELIHRAHNRENFAVGAIKAAKWIKGKNPSLYTMQHVLGFTQI